ncbi:MAG TPA: hypothetical protein VHW23_26880 [Kofleriaceae bacterium]|jgi:hypothetical protein|nr:hypothetical protein [Kofleriaceae bacterium]
MEVIGMSELSKAVDLVRQARWESWQRMAAQLPDRRVLAVEMFRVDHDTTVAVYTLVRGGKVVQQVLRGDGSGLNVQPVAPGQAGAPIDLGAQQHLETLLMAIALATDGGGTAFSVALGDPPPKGPVEPGIVAVGGVGMQSTFDTGESS